MHLVPSIPTHTNGACLAAVNFEQLPTKDGVASTTCPGVAQRLIRVTQQAWTLSSGATNGFSKDAA